MDYKQYLFDFEYYEITLILNGNESSPFRKNEDSCQQ